MNGTREWGRTPTRPAWSEGVFRFICATQRTFRTSTRLRRGLHGSRTNMMAI